jgi:hypothetical protein
VPKSKVRKKNDAPVRARSATPPSRQLTPSPPWYPVLMAGLLLLGLAYLVVWYLAPNAVPVMQDIHAWNFAVGFGLMLAGLVLAVRWR